jgi:hypothetical protein
LNRIFIGSHSLPPLSGSPFRSFREKARASLVWISREKWLSTDFSLEDCYPTRERDVLVKQLTQLKFPERILGKGEKKSFVQALKSIVERGRGGRNL